MTTTPAEHPVPQPTPQHEPPATTKDAASTCAIPEAGERTIQFTTFVNEQSNLGRLGRSTLDKFYERWRVRESVPAGTPKKGQPLIAPVVFEGNRRANENVLLVHLQVVEFDNNRKERVRNEATGKVELKTVPLPVEERATFAQTVEFVRSQGWSGIVVTSYSHAPEHHKGRAYLLTSRAVTPSEHRRLQWVLHDRFTSAGIIPDPATVDPARIWYLPIHREGHEYLVERIHGKPIDVDALLAEAPPERGPRSNSGHEPGEVGGAPQGARCQGSEQQTRLAQWIQDEIRPAVSMKKLLGDHGEQLVDKGSYAQVYMAFARDDGERPAGVVYNDDHLYDFGTGEVYDAIEYLRLKLSLSFWDACDQAADLAGVPHFNRTKAPLPAVKDPAAAFAALPEQLPDSGRECVLQPVIDAIATLDAVDREPWVERLLERYRVGRRHTLPRPVVEGLIKKATESFLSPPAVERPTNVDDRYRVESGCLSEVVYVEGQETTRPLCNGAVEIVEVATHDDGAESRDTFKIKVTVSDGTELPVVEVPTKDFDDMEWVTPGTHGRLHLEPERRTGPLLRHAILSRSNPVRTTTFGHLGWRKVGHQDVFLTAAGAVGTDVPVVVRPAGDRLAKVCLPSIPEAGVQQTVDAIRMVLTGFCRAAPLGITTPLLCAQLWAPLTDVLPCRTVFTVIGRTGTLKTALVTQLQRMWGSEFRTDTDLPLNFETTWTTAEGILFAAKNCLVVMDDYFPRRTLRDADAQRSLADRVIRSVGNGQDRGRSHADLRIRAARPPRAVVVMTCEEDPAPADTGESAANRTIKLHLCPGDVRTGRLSEVQAFEPLHYAMRAYLEWLSSNSSWKTSVRERYLELLGELRAEAGMQSRQPDSVASMLVAFDLFAEFVQSFQHEARTVIVTSAGRAAVMAKAREILVSLASGQAEVQRSTSPEMRWLDAVRHLLVSGRVRLLAKNQTLASWGSSPDVGWYDETTVYLHPATTHAAVTKLLRDQGEEQAFRLATIFDMLVHRSIAEPRTDKNHVGARVSLGGGRVYVVQIDRSHFDGVPIGVVEELELTADGDGFTAPASTTPTLNAGAPN